MDRMEWLGHLQVTVSNHMIDGKNGQDLTLINHDIGLMIQSLSLHRVM